MGGVYVMLLGGGSSCQQCGCGESCPAPDYTSVGYDIADNVVYLAQSYVTPSGGITLTSATLTIAGYDPLQATLPPGSYTNYPRCRLYANVDGTGPDVGLVRPDTTALATLTAPAIGTLGNATWVFTHAGYALTGGSRYWISLELNGYWEFYELPDVGDPPTDICYGPSSTFSTTAAASWQFNSQLVKKPYLLTIN
jgi:hypothetical protein